MPTLIDELTMTLALNPTGFQQGASEAKSASDSLLAQMLANLNKIEQATKETAANTARVQETAASKAETEAERAAKAQEAAARRAASETEAAARKTGEQMKATGRQIEEGFDKVGNSIRRVGVELLSMMGIAMSVSAMERLFMNITKTNAQMGQLARSMNVSVESLSAWTGAASRLGTTSEAISGSFGKIQEAFEELHLHGSSQTFQGLRDLFGVNMFDAKGGRKSPEQIIREITQSAERNHMLTPEIAKKLSESGLDPNLAPMVAKGTAEQDRQLAIQKRTGNVVGWGEGVQSKKLIDDMNILSQTVEGTAKSIVEALSPAIDGVVTRIQKWLDKNKQWLTNEAVAWATNVGNAILHMADEVEKFVNEGGLTTISEDVKILAGDAVAIAEAANSAAEAVGGWKVVMEAFFAIWAAGKVAGVLRTMGTFLGLAKGIGSVFGIGGTVAEGAAGAAGVAGGAVVAPALATAALTAAATYAAFKNGSMDAKAMQLGYAPSKYDDQGLTVTEFSKNGQTFDRMTVQKLVAEREQELADIAKNTKDAADQLKRLTERTMPGGAAPEGGIFNPPTDMGRLPANTAAKGAEIRDRMMADLNIPQSGASAFVGNLIAESGLVAGKQEGNPLSGRGGLGYAQWTGDRRLRFEAYLARTGQPASSDAANYGFLIEELKTVYPGLLQKLRGLEGNPNARAIATRMIMEVFEGPGKGYEREGVRQKGASDVDTVPVRPRAAPAPAPGFSPLVPVPGAPAVRSSWLPDGASSLGASAAAQRTQVASTSLDQSRSSQTHIGEVHVHTAATDAAGIARDLKRELRRFDYAAQADTGLA